MRPEPLVVNPNLSMNGRRRPGRNSFRGGGRAGITRELVEKGEMASSDTKEFVDELVKKGDVAKKDIEDTVKKLTSIPIPARRRSPPCVFPSPIGAGRASLSTYVRASIWPIR